jgi:hypothetical protein
VDTEASRTVGASSFRSHPWKNVLCFKGTPPATTPANFKAVRRDSLSGIRLSSRQRQQMGVWRNGSASDFDCHSLVSEGCSFEYCHAHSFLHFHDQVLPTRFHLRRVSSAPSTSVLDVWPTATTAAATATATSQWPIRIHHARVDIHWHGIVWLNSDSTTTIWRWSLWCHSKPIDFDWYGSFWLHSATTAATPLKYFWIYYNWDSGNGIKWELVWIHESSTAAAAATTTTTTAATNLALW